MLFVERDLRLRESLCCEDDPIRIAGTRSPDVEAQAGFLEQLTSGTLDGVFTRLARPAGRCPGPVALELRPRMGTMQEQILDRSTGVAINDYRGARRPQG